MTMPRLLQRILLGAIERAARLLQARSGRAGPRPVRRSLWAGTPIINMAVNARAERRLGVDARSLVYETYFVTRAFDINLRPIMRVPVLRAVVPYAVLLWAVLRFDRFHFYLDRGLLPPEARFTIDRAELALLRRLGKQVFLWAYGADVRTTAATRALGEPNCCTACPAPGSACVCEDDRQQRAFGQARALVTAVFSMGDMTHYTPGSMNDLYYWPVDLDAEEGARYRPSFPDPAADRPLRIVHAPNHRAFKGTEHLLAAVERMKEAGCAVDLVLVERVPNREALELYRSADVIFDQCLIGFHGYFANEAMALGKPVLCFIRDPERYLLAPAECPIVNIRPDTIAPTLLRLAGDRALLHDLGRRGRAYIERYHSPAAFAQRLAAAYARAGAA